MFRETNTFVWKMLIRTSAAFLLICQFGCSPDGDTSAPRQAATNAANSDLVGLTEADVTEARLPGELVCTFSENSDTSLLYASGNVAAKDAAEGIVKIGEVVERVSAPGGFEGMTRGASFKGEHVSVDIKLTGPASGGGESPRYPATATVVRKDEANRVLQGHWQCGP